MSFKLSPSGDLIQEKSQCNNGGSFQMNPSGDLLKVSGNPNGSRKSSFGARNGGGFGSRNAYGSNLGNPCASRNGAGAMQSACGPSSGGQDCPPAGQEQLRKEWEDQRREIVVLKNQLKQTEDVVRCELQIQERNLQNLQCQWAQEKQELVQERNSLKKELCCLMEGTKKKLKQMEETHKCEQARAESGNLREKRALQDQADYYKNELRCLYQRMANVLDQTQIRDINGNPDECNPNRKC